MLFSNASFLALPLAQAVIGSEGVFYCSVYVAVFNVVAFTYGIYEISGHTAKIDLRRLVLNPGSMVAAVLFAAQAAPGDPAAHGDGGQL